MRSKINVWSAATNNRTDQNLTEFNALIIDFTCMLKQQTLQLTLMFYINKNELCKMQGPDFQNLLRRSYKNDRT